MKATTMETTNNHNRTLRMVLQATERINSAVRFLDDLEQSGDAQQSEIDMVFDDLTRSIEYIQRRLATLKIDYRIN